MSQVNKDIEKLQKQIAREKAMQQKLKKKSALLQTQKTMEKQLFAERRQLQQDLAQLKRSHTPVGRAFEKAKTAEKKVEEFIQKPETRKTLKAIDKFLGG